jgi:hypothetical protein
MYSINMPYTSQTTFSYNAPVGGFGLQSFAPMGLPAFGAAGFGAASCGNCGSCGSCSAGMVGMPPVPFAAPAIAPAPMMMWRRPSLGARLLNMGLHMLAPRHHDNGRHLGWGHGRGFSRHAGVRQRGC